MKTRLHTLWHVVLTVASCGHLATARQGTQEGLSNQAKDIVHDLVADQDQRDVVNELIAEASTEHANEEPPNSDFPLQGVSDAADETMVPQKFAVILSNEGENNVDEQPSLAIEASSNSLGGAAALASGARDLPVSGNEGAQESTDFIRDRLAAAESENEALRQHLERVDKDKGSLWSQVLTDKTDLQKIPMLQHDLLAVRAAKHDEDVSLLAEQEREQYLTRNLYNATQAATRERQALEWAQSRGNSLQQENSKLVALVKKANAEKKTLEATLESTNQSRRASGALLRNVQLKLHRTSTRLHQVQSDVDRLESAKARVEERAEAAELAEQSERKRKEASDAALIHLRESSDIKTKQIRAERVREQELTNKSQSLARSLDVARANLTSSEHKIEELKVTKRTLRSNIALLKHLMEDNDKSQQKEIVDLRSKDTVRKRDEAELKQLRGSVPWLQAKVAAEEKQINTVSSQMHRAQEERDAVKAMLTQSRNKVVELETQYATVVQELASLSGKSDGGAAVEPPPYEDFSVF